MSNKLYRTILGAILLAALYFDVEKAIFAVTAIVLFEGVTNWRIPRLVNKVRKIAENDSMTETQARFFFEAERAFRIMVGVIVLSTYLMGPDSMLWFFPWFMAFAIFGAGVSGICPALLTLKWLGFR